MSTLYRPLDIETYEVRMLAFSAKHSSAIECTMRTVSLIRNPPRYMALSYCWGDANVTTNIKVNGVTVAVTLNLEAAFQHLRCTLDHDVMLWADALCINQKDNQERSQQVRLMTQIYTKAESCYAWLGGQEHVEAAAGLLTIKTWDALSSDVVEITRTRAIQAACAGFLSICRCPYWRRRWVIQEFTAAQDVQIICMNETASLEVIRSAYAICSASQFWLPEHRLATSSFAQILHFRLEYHENQVPSLSSAIFETQQFLSMDRRDRIFALIGICKDGSTLVPSPNYSQSVNDISIDLTRALLRRNANFDLIFTGQTTRNISMNTVSFPTWATNWCSSGLCNKASTAADRETEWPRSLAASALRADPTTLRMEGVTLGTIVALSSPLSRHESEHGTVTTSLGTSSSQQNSSHCYYGSKPQTSAALRMLILGIGYSALHSSYKHRAWPSSTKVRSDRGTSAGSKDLESVFSAWLRSNDQLMNNGSSLHSYFALHLLLLAESTLCVALLVGLIMILASLVGLIFILLKWPEVIVICVLGACEILGIVLVRYSLVRMYRLRAIYVSSVSLSRSIEQSRRLYVLDTGMLGTTSSSAQVSDKVCFLAGCTNDDAAILGAHRIQNAVLHSVVGNARVEMNALDKEKYGALWCDRDKLSVSEGDKKRLVLQTLDRYRKLDWWERFTII